MEQISTINVEEIMKEIRKEIAEKGYTSDMLSFEDVSGITAVEVGYDDNEYRTIVEALNRCAHVPWYRDLGQGGIRGFIKKVIRKLNTFLIAPMSDEQNVFNARTVQAVNQITVFMDKQNECLEAYKKEIETLNKRVKTLENELKNNKE